MTRVTNARRGEYAVTNVPEGANVPAPYIALVMIGGTIAVPGFLMASQIASGAGLSNAVVGFVVGCQVLAVLGILTGSVGRLSRLSTYMVLQFSFGTRGYRIPNTIIAAVLCFWFAILCRLFADAGSAALVRMAGWTIDARLLGSLGGILMVLITIYGFKALDRLSRFVVPLMAVILIWGLLRSVLGADLDELSEHTGEAMAIGAAVSAVIGAYSGGIVTLPDYIRYARSLPAAALAIYFALGISFPLVLLVTAIPSILAGTSDLIAVFIASGLGISALIVLLFSTVTSNVGMLYSASLSLSASLSSVSFSKAAIALGVVAVMISNFEVIDLFVKYITFLGISIPALAGIYVCDFFVIRRRQYQLEALPSLPSYHWPAFVAWAAGFVVGLAAVFKDIALTSAPAIDSIAASALTYCALARGRTAQNTVDAR